MDILQFQTHHRSNEHNVHHAVRTHPIPRCYTFRNQFRPRNQIPPIPEFRFSNISINARNSGITIYTGLFMNDEPWLSIEFRYGIPGITESQLILACL